MPSWRDGAATSAIVAFVESAVRDVPPAERVATFDNDGTLWCEKPMPIELMFILQRLAAMAEQDPSLRERQPWKAAYDKDYEWLSDVITKHYAGDDSDVKVLLGGILQAFAGMTVEEYAAAADPFVNTGAHPTLGRPFTALRVPADGRAAAVPRGERVHRLHRVGRQPGLHADVQPRRSTGSRPSG